MKTAIDINDLRQRHANSIRNTATGRALGEALAELESLRKYVAHMERKNLHKCTDAFCPICDVEET